MADNIGYTPGAGADIAADDVGGVLYQRVKLTTGEDGTATDVSEAAPLPVADADSGSLLRRILQMLMAPLGYDKSLQRNRVTALIESGTVTTVTTVGAVTSLNNIDGYNARMQILDQNRTSWALNVRARIT
jgi:NADPH:quinone reductase-like Zn-dependent oxidoreductase